MVVNSVTHFGALQGVFPTLLGVLMAFDTLLARRLTLEPSTTPQIPPAPPKPTLVLQTPMRPNARVEFASPVVSPPPPANFAYMSAAAERARSREQRFTVFEMEKYTSGYASICHSLV